MTTTELILLSLALAIDVLGVSFSYGLIIKKNRFKQMLSLAGSCAIMQALMPVIGYVATAPLSQAISQYDYIIVCLIFVLLGAHIIYETLYNQKEDDKLKALTLSVIITLSIATSIDALVSGCMIYMTKTPLFHAISIIGLTSFLIGLIGFNLKFVFKKVPEKYLQLLAGIVLIGLGLKNLIFHFI